MGPIDKVCYVFPGQGSQFPGMGKDLYDKYEYVKNIFLTGNKILKADLKFNITDLIFNGSKEELKKTIHCQPAMLLTNFAYFKVLTTENKKIPCSLTLGHSIGEYSALVASEALSLEDALKLVQIRAESMTQCIPKKTSMIKYAHAEKEKQNTAYMAAVLKNNPKLIDLVKEACKTYSSYEGINKGIVQIANINSSSQIVISGNNNALIRAAEHLISKGIKVIYLSVEGPFHSELMRPAAKRMEEALKNIEIIKPKIPLIANTGKFIFEPNEIKEELVNQICGTVEWKQSLELAIENGFKTFIESGPGNVQTRLLGRNKDINNVLDVKKCINPNYLLN